MDKGIVEVTVKVQKWGLPRRLVILSTGVAFATALLFFMLLRLLHTPPLPPSLLEQGRDLYQSGSYSFAVDKLRAEVLRSPADQEALLLLAQSFVKLRQWSAAQSYLKERLVTLPGDGAALYWLGNAQFGNGRTAEAERTWQSLVERKIPLYQSLARLALAEMQFKQGAYNQAALLLYQIQTSRENLEPVPMQRIFYLYGLLLARDQRFEDASSQLENALNVKGGGIWSPNRPVQNILAITSERASAVLTSLAAFNPSGGDKVEAARRAKLAYAYIRAEEYGLAEEQLIQVVSIAPNFADAQAYRGLVYWRTNRSSQAINALTLALNKEPKNKLARQILAELYIDRVQTFQPELASAAQSKTESETARRLLESLLSEKPDDVLLLTDMARLSIGLRDYDSAEAFYYLALKANTDKPRTGINPGAMLARFYAETGFDPCKRGIEAGAQAARDFPQDAESWYAYALAYSFCHKPSEAAPLLEKALGLKPYWPDALNRLALTYQALGRQNEADKLFAAAVDLDPSRVWPRQ